ncbi:MAG: DNA/RNA nuclease SfsA [Alphaproteobacteria bacterium]
MCALAPARGSISCRPARACHLPSGGKNRDPQSYVRHLHDLPAMVTQVARAMLLCVVQRQDCDRLLIARGIDPKYQAACRASPQSVRLDRALPVMV